MDERLYWLGFSVFPGIGPMKFMQLLSFFDSAENAWKASFDDLQEAGIGDKLAAQFLSFRKTFSLGRYAEKLEQKSIFYLLLSDNEYPALLKQIKNPPFVLYVKGNLQVFSHPGRSEATDRISGDSISQHAASFQNDKKIAVVGTRKITQYGKEVTRIFTESLVTADCIIVSGLALGVDAVAHQTTLENQGKTIAVLGCGVDCCTPSSNQHIYDRIIDSGGAVVSEFPLSAAPSLGSFPSRNRIIAGLCSGVVVTEGAEDSGALITADEALKNGRKAYAVPGPITSVLSKGPYKLIARGGKLVISAEDILSDLQIKSIKGITGIKSIKGDTAEEQQIIDLLEREALHFDELVKKANMGAAQLAALLSLMEVKGLLHVTAQGNYVLQ